MLESIRRQTAERCRKAETWRSGYPEAREAKKIWGFREPKDTEHLMEGYTRVDSVGARASKEMRPWPG